MHLAILLFALFASLFTLQKTTLQYTEPFFLVGARMTFAGILLLSYLKFFKKYKFNIEARHIKDFVMLGISAIYLTNIFEIWSINNMVSSKACLIYSLSPFVTALIGFIMIKEVLSPKKWLGMLIGFIGLIPIFFAQSQDELAAGKLFIFSYAELSLLGAVFFSVYGWIIMKRLMQDFTPFVANSIAMTLGGVLALAHSYISGEAWHPIPVTNIQPFIINSLVMCLISNIICYNLYGMLLKRFTATFMSFAGLVTPFFASIYGYLFLGETVSWHYFASISLFSLGLVIFYKEEITRDNAFVLKEVTN